MIKFASSTCIKHVILNARLVWSLDPTHGLKTKFFLIDKICYLPKPGPPLDKYGSL